MSGTELEATAGPELLNRVFNFFFQPQSAIGRRLRSEVEVVPTGWIEQLWNEFNKDFPLQENALEERFRGWLSGPAASYFYRAFKVSVPEGTTYILIVREAIKGFKYVAVLTVAMKDGKVLHGVHLPTLRWLDDNPDDPVALAWIRELQQRLRELQQRLA